METKEEIRRIVYRKRKKLSESLWRKLSKEVEDAVLSHPWFLVEENIYTYVAANQEAETRGMIDAAFKAGKKVWVPKITEETMDFYRIRSLCELRPGKYGIMEPAGNAEADRDRKVSIESSAGTSGLMIMPGVAFDEQCRRIGYGGGYYDRYLAEHPGYHTMALAFEFQVFSRVPQGRYDIRPELLVTERRIRCRQDCQKIR